MARHRDKYAHLRPKLDRQCHRNDRVPKARMAEPAARAAAARLDGYHAYECPLCGTWHIGNDRSRRAQGSEEASR